MEKEAAIKIIEKALSGPLRELSGTEPWLNSIRNGQVASAITEIELALQDESNQAQNRIWWIYCQLLLRQVPIMALAAPLEEALPQFKTQSSIPIHVLFVCLSCSFEIHQKQQYVLSAHLFLESVTALSKSSSIDAETKYNIFLGICTLLETALKEVDNDPRQTIAAEELRGAITKVQEFKFEKGAASEKPDVQNNKEQSDSTVRSSAQKSHFSAKSILELDDAKQEATTAEPWGEIPLVSKNQKRSVASAVVLIAIVVGAAGAIYLALPQPASMHASIETISEDATLLLPNINQKDHFLQQESERIVSDLKALSDKLKTIPTAIEPEASAPDMAKAIETPKTDTPEDASPRRQTKPANEDDLYYQPSTTFGDPLDKQPRLDPKEILAPQIEQLDINKNVNRAITPEITDLKEDANGRRFGKPVEAAEKSPYAGRRSLDGGPLQSHEVKLLDPPVHYRTITPTDVLSHPSFVSRSLVRLDVNSTVLAVAKMGQWLEIRSVQGRQGYVLAQDVIEDTSATRNE